MAKIVQERADAVAALAEVFRAHGFEGASLSIITRETGLGKGSLYHFFPGGKQEMGEAVLSAIHAWFEREIFVPLRDDPNPKAALSAMVAGCARYFQGGGRICLVGLLALGRERDVFSQRIAGYFTEWQRVLVGALIRAGVPSGQAEQRALTVLIAIQGGLVMARAQDDVEIFRHSLDQVRQTLMIA